MCTIKNQSQITICDVSRDKVKQVVGDQLGPAVTFETIDGEGTLVSCLETSRISEFQQWVSKALDWTGERWFASTPS
jgi:hypothetical protein